MDTKNTPPKEPAWLAEVRDHFESQKVGIHQASSLEALLLASPVAQSASQNQRTGASSVFTASVPPLGEGPLPPPLPPVATGLLSRAVRRAHASGVGYVVAALVAASATFLVQQERGFGGFDDDAFDPIADLANQPGPRAYPADFDLEGDPAGFREVVQEVFPHQDVFSADLGKQLAGGGYTPSEGRFFSWSGEPGVSILLKGEQGGDAAPATLYIVRLTDKNEQKFPRERTLKRVTGRTGKVRKVNVWRDGRYGYAMVQSVALSD